jgi:uncharacterized protein YukE
MADTTPITPAEAAELIKLMKELRDITISDAKAFEKLVGGAEDFRKELGSLRNEQKNINSDINTFYEILKRSLTEINKTKNATKDTSKSFEKLSSIASKLKYDQDGISTLTKKQLQTSLETLRQEQKNLEISRKINVERLNEVKSALQNENLSFRKRAALNAEKALLENSIRTTSGFLRDQELGYQNLKKAVTDRLKEEERIQSTLGISGKIVDGIVGALGKLGISSTFFENLKEDMRETAKSGSKWEVMMKGMKGVASGVGEALKDPVTQLTILLKIANFFFKAALNANAQAVELGKQLGYGSQRADAFREKMVSIENSSRNLNVNTATLTQAFGELVKSTGFAYEFTADQLTTQIKLTKQVGLQADEAAQVQRYAALSGKSSEETYRSFVRGLTTARNQLRVGIDFRSTLAEAVKVSGQLAANLGYNPERIAKAVVAMKALGTTLEDTKSQADSLLNFESSIENELKAELLTGQALNLERARALALQGDMAGVAQELANQGMTAAKFSKMNVLAQNAYAQALGTTSDKLSEQLRKREEAVKSGKSLKQINEEEAAQALERQNVQDKFNAAMEKLQRIVGDLLAGPLGSFLDLLSGALNIINYMATPLKIIGGIFLGIKATQLAINAYKRIGLGLDIASKGENMISANMGLATIASKRTQTALEKESLLTKIAGNAQLLFSLMREQGIAGIKAYASGLEEKSLARKIIMGIYEGASVIAARTKALFEGFSLKSLIGSIAKYPAILAMKGTEAAIATETAGATVVAAEAISVGMATVWIVAGLAAVMGAMAGYAMKDGEIDPSKGPVMTGGFGSVQLDPKDKAMYGADGKIKVGTDLAGGGEGGGGGVNIDLSPVVSALAEVKAAIDQLLNKEGVVMMDSVKVGTTQNMNGTYKTA